MASAEPIAAPTPDFEATRIVRPRPGGAPPAAPAEPIAAPAPEFEATRIVRPGRAAPPAPPPADPPGLATLQPGAATTLAAAAMPLVQLLGRLRALPSEPDPALLRDRTEAALRSFEARATETGTPPDQVRRALYALADALDDAVLNTPWGAAGPWAARPMVASLLPGVPPGRFFDALRQATAKPDAARPLLELLLLLASVGVLGPYRGTPGGAAEVEALRQAAAAALGTEAPPLSEQWRGVDAPYRRRRARLPVWVVASAALLLAGGIYLALGTRLNAAGDAVFADMLAAPPAAMPAITRVPVPPPPAPPPPPEPSAQDRLRTRLAPLLADRALTVVGTPAAPVLRIADDRLFPPSSATPLPGAAALLDAVAAALRPEAGHVSVLGYLDDRPVRTVAFPSAFRLTAARAEAVRASLLRGLGTGAQVAAEGRASADPVAPNATPAGRDANRRVDILLEGAAP